MAKFRKRPVVVEASQWFQDGDHPDVRPYRRPDVHGYSRCEQCGLPHEAHGWIDTLEQGHRVCPCDWIITGVAGEKYPCKPLIFAETYERE